MIDALLLLLFLLCFCSNARSSIGQFNSFFSVGCKHLWKPSNNNSYKLPLDFWFTSWCAYKMIVWFCFVFFSHQLLNFRQSTAASGPESIVIFRRRRRHKHRIHANGQQAFCDRSCIRIKPDHRTGSVSELRCPRMAEVVWTRGDRTVRRPCHRHHTQMAERLSATQRTRQPQNGQPNCLQPFIR